MSSIELKSFFSSVRTLFKEVSILTVASPILFRLFSTESFLGGSACQGHFSFERLVVEKVFASLAALTVIIFVLHT